ncbi:hypothetical protein T12_2980 [Trichinella patagoniensis]|uniref:PiggyBac transposable element-derived protein domain-containing protein n=1 Tax=Trichinella patagoniensis TaxID=990121 RepID=A0A0V0Z5N9_9BILA|nr:hypothetical protein T12_2980 [Trichinella patagoniensis]
MDCDLYLRLTRSGRIIKELTVLLDADISEPEMDSDDDQRSSSVVECSADLTSEDEETDTFRRAEFRWRKEGYLLKMPHLRNAIENLTCSSAAVFDVLVYGTANAPLQIENDLKKAGQGAFHASTTAEKNLCVVRWYDSAVVELSSSYKPAEGGQEDQSKAEPQE